MSTPVKNAPASFPEHLLPVEQLPAGHMCDMTCRHRRLRPISDATPAPKVDPVAAALAARAESERSARRSALEAAEKVVRGEFVDPKLITDPNTINSLRPLAQARVSVRRRILERGSVEACEKSYLDATTKLEHAQKARDAAVEKLDKELEAVRASRAEALFARRDASDLVSELGEVESKVARWIESGGL